MKLISTSILSSKNRVDSTVEVTYFFIRNNYWQPAPPYDAS